MKLRDFIGEFSGTFLLVLFGCGTVAVDTLFGAHVSLALIALFWGVGVTLSIYLTRHLCCAHLNPAVTVAMACSGRMSWKKVPTYLVAQFLGAFAAGWIIYALFSPAIAKFEADELRKLKEPAARTCACCAKTVDTAQNADTQNADDTQTADDTQNTDAKKDATPLAKTADDDASYEAAIKTRTGRMFGEYYDMKIASFRLACFAEGFGTFLLVLLIFALTEGCNVGRPSSDSAPLWIGLTVSSVICLVAPLTQAGLNPARDFGPRVVAYLMGWGKYALPDACGGFFWVYILAPIVGGGVAAILFTKLYEPLMNRQSSDCCCGKKKD